MTITMIDPEYIHAPDAMLVEGDADHGVRVVVEVQSADRMRWSAWHVYRQVAPALRAVLILGELFGRESVRMRAACEDPEAAPIAVEVPACADG